MGGRGIKRPKKEEPKKQPKQPKKKGTGTGTGTGEGGGGGGFLPMPMPPREEPKEREPQQAPPITGGSKTVRVGGMYYKVENGKLTKLGSSKESYDFKDGKVTISIGDKQYEVSEKGTVRELPKKEEDNSDNAKLRRFLGDYTSTSPTVEPSDTAITRMKKLKEQAKETVDIFKQAGVNIPTHDEMVQTFMKAGLKRKQAEDFAGNHKYILGGVYTDEYKGGRQAQVSRYNESEDIQQGVKLQAYMISKTIASLKSDILNEDALKDTAIINKFRTYNTKPSVGGGMDSENTYYVPLNRLGLSKFTNSKSGNEGHNVDFTIEGVAVHETGHALNNLVRKINPSLQSDFDMAYQKLNMFGLTPSGYASTSREEFFAEAFLGYVKYRHWKQPSHMATYNTPLVSKPKFDVNNPIYDVMEEVLKKSGLLKGHKAQEGSLDISIHSKINEYIFKNVTDWDVKVSQGRDPMTGQIVLVKALTGTPLKELYPSMYKKYGM